MHYLRRESLAAGARPTLELLHNPPALTAFRFCIAFGDRQTREKGL